MKNTKKINKFLTFSLIFSMLIGLSVNSVFAATQDDIANIENKIVNIQNEINQLNEIAESKIAKIKEEAQKQKDELMTQLNGIANDETKEERKSLMDGIENLEDLVNAADKVDFSNPITYERFKNEVSELDALNTKNQELLNLKKELEVAKNSLETIEETIKETVEETLKETIKETPKETIKETPKEIIKETPKETIIETIKESGNGTIKETIVDNIKENPNVSDSNKYSFGNDGKNSENNNNLNNQKKTIINPIMVGSLIDTKMIHNIITDNNNSSQNENKKDVIVANDDTNTTEKNITAKAKIDNPKTSDDFNICLMSALLTFSIVGIIVIEKNKKKI